MPSYKAATHQDALKLVQLMANHGATADLQLDHRTIKYWNRKAWQRVRAQWKQMQETRQLADRYNERIKQEELL